MIEADHRLLLGESVNCYWKEEWERSWGMTKVENESAKNKRYEEVNEGREGRAGKRHRTLVEAYINELQSE